MDLKGLEYYFRNLINYLKDFWNDGWEKKALIVMGVVVFIILVYAYNPFYARTNITGNVDSQIAPVSPVPVTTPNTGTVSSNNSTNSSDNVNYLISEEQAKKIALQGNSGFRAGQPIQGTVVVNQTTTVVWIVPITKASQSKNVYVDVNTGKIVEV